MDAQRFSKIRDWEEAGGEARLAWVKVNVDYDRASVCLRQLFGNYVDMLVAKFGKGSVALAEDLKLSFRPVALLADFTRDYGRMLDRLYEQLRGIFHERLIETINARYKDFYIIKLDSDRKALSIVNAFVQCLQDYFPRLCDDSPIMLSVSTAPGKFPFFDHWRYLQKPETTINLQVPGSVRLEVSLATFQDLRSLRVHEKRIGTFLHKLVDIEMSTRSKLLVEVELLRGASSFSEVVNLYKLGRFTSGELLGYYKLARG